MEGNSRGRKNISHSVIFEYWKDKAITKDGDVVIDTNDPGTVPVIEDYAVPTCFGCGDAAVNVLDEPKYDDDLAKGKFKKIWTYKDAKSKLHRCHIIPHMLGGDESPENILLLCRHCHEESPDTANKKNMMRWLYKKRSSGKFFVNGVDVLEMIQQVFDECAEQGKDPLSGNVDEMCIGLHGTPITQSSFVYAYVDTCKSNTDQSED